MSSARWQRRLVGSGAALVAAKALHITAVDDWEDILSYPGRKWKKVVSKWTATSKPPVPHVVVLGTGWGALSFLRHIDGSEMRVTVVSPRPFFFYTPLLAGTATGTVSHHSIIEPIRWFCEGDDLTGVTFVQAECEHVNVSGKTITCRYSDDSGSMRSSKQEFSVPYDHLVISVGAEPTTFNIPGVKENAHFMKEIADSIDVQDKILKNLELANTILASGSYSDLSVESAAEVDRLLHWVVVGGGPTGVELVAEITDFIRKDVAKYFPSLRGRCRITLLEATGKLLATFDASTSEYARGILEGRGAVVLTDTMVTKIDTGSVSIRSRQPINGSSRGVTALPPSLLMPICETNAKPADGSTVDEVRSGLVVWAGGITMRPFMREFIQTQLPKEEQTARWGVVVDGFCRVKGAENKGLWALGDCAVVEGCAPTAQAATQQGAFLGRLFRDNLKYFDQTLLPPLHPGSENSLREPIPPWVHPFEYLDKGALAYVGGNQGVAELKNLIWVGYPYFRKRSPSDANGKSTKTEEDRGLKVQGKGAFAIWRSVYFSKLMSFRNVCQVCFDWGKTLVFGRDIASVHRPTDTLSGNRSTGVKK